MLAAIVGASGYSGQETLDRVLAHPELDLIAHNNTTNTDTTAATYTFTSANKVAGAAASSAPTTLSFNTAAYATTRGTVAFMNGSYPLRVQAVVAAYESSLVTPGA